MSRDMVSNIGADAVEQHLAPTLVHLSPRANANSLDIASQWLKAFLRLSTSMHYSHLTFDVCSRLSFSNIRGFCRELPCHDAEPRYGRFFMSGGISQLLSD